MCASSALRHIHWFRSLIATPINTNVKCHPSGGKLLRSSSITGVFAGNPDFLGKKWHRRLPDSNKIQQRLKGWFPPNPTNHPWISGSCDCFMWSHMLKASSSRCPLSSPGLQGPQGLFLTKAGGRRDTMNHHESRTFAQYPILLYPYSSEWLYKSATWSHW